MEKKNLGTVGELTDYLTYLRVATSANRETINCYKVGLKQVFSTLFPENWRDISLADIDIKQTMERYISITSDGDHPSKRARTYRNRALKAILKYGSQAHAQSHETASKIEAAKRKSRNNTICRMLSGVVEHPFPLSNGGMAMLQLPLNLNRADADRLIQYINSLVIE